MSIKYGISHPLNVYEIKTSGQEGFNGYKDSKSTIKTQAADNSKKLGILNKSVTKNTILTYDNFDFPTSSTSRDSPDVSFCLTASKYKLEYTAGTDHTLASCKWNALTKYSQAELAEYKSMTQANVRFGLSNRQSSTSGFVLPSSSKQSKVFDEYMAYQHPSNAVDRVEQEVILDVSGNYEWFGYLVAKNSDNETNVRISITPNVTVNSGSLVNNTYNTGYTVQCWVGKYAVMNYTNATAISGSINITRGIIYPIRIRLVYVAKSTRSNNNRTVKIHFKPDNTIGLYCFLDKNNKLMYKKQYLYGLEPETNRCVVYSTTDLSGGSACTKGTILMNSLDISPDTNTYITYDGSKRVKTPISIDGNATTYSTSNKWLPYSGFAPVQLNSFSNTDSNVTNADNCLKKVGSGATVALFDSSSNNCYYTTDTPPKGVYTNVVVQPNNSSTLYIRSADSARSMDKHTLSATKYGDAYASLKFLNDMRSKNWNAVDKTNNKTMDTVTSQLSSVTTETFTDGEIYGAINAARDAGASGNARVSSINTTLSNIDGQISTLQEQVNRVNYVAPGSGSEYANQVYNILHPNQPSTAVDVHQRDSDELRMQYNNLLVIGSIAAATFSIGAIIALSVR
jgi:hypothetical protein